MEKTNDKNKALILDYVRKISEATRLANEGDKKNSLIASAEAEQIAKDLNMRPEEILLAGSQLI